VIGVSHRRGVSIPARHFKWALGGNEGKRVGGQRVGPESDVMNVRELVADQRRTGQLLHQLEIRRMLRIANLVYLHAVGSIASSQLHLAIDDGSPFRAQQ